MQYGTFEFGKRTINPLRLEPIVSHVLPNLGVMRVVSPSSASAVIDFLDQDYRYKSLAI